MVKAIRRDMRGNQPTKKSQARGADLSSIARWPIGTETLDRFPVPKRRQGANPARQEPSGGPPLKLAGACIEAMTPGRAGCSADGRTRLLSHASDAPVGRAGEPWHHQTTREEWRELLRITFTPTRNDLAGVRTRSPPVRRTVGVQTNAASTT